MELTSRMRNKHHMNEQKDSPFEKEDQNTNSQVFGETANNKAGGTGPEGVT